MTDVTVIESPEGGFAEELLQATITDTYTYVSKLSSIKNVQVTWNDEVATAGAGTAITKLPSVSVSGRTITFTTGENADGTANSGGTAYIMIKGRL